MLVNDVRRPVVSTELPGFPEGSTVRKITENEKTRLKIKLTLSYT